MSNELELQLQNALITTYLANLAFLSEYDNKLYNRIIGLSDSIDSGEHKERYFLEFLKESGDFDIYDSHTEKYIYNKKPKKYNDEATNGIKHNTKGEFFTLEKKFFYEYNFEETKNKEISFDSFYDSRKFMINDLKEYVNILDENLTDVKNKEYKKIDKFVFIGTLLSRHILSIVNKLKPKHFFICEESLEIFRLSLFVFDYTLLVEDERTVVFSIMDSSADFDSKFRIFYINHSMYNANLKYYETGHNTEHYFDLIFDSLISSKATSFDYYMMLKTAKLSFERINNFNILCSEKPISNNYLKDKKVLLVGAGPSLEENIEWLKDNQNKFIIVGVGASFNKLIDSGIRVDIVTTLDPSYKIIEELQFNDESVKKLNDVLVFASINTHEKILEKFNEDNLFIFPTVYPFYSDAKTQYGYSIGEISTILLLQLGVEELYLVGLDFAINKKTGQTHNSSNSSIFEYDVNSSLSSLDKNSFDINEDLVQVKGNQQDYVYTNRRFNISNISLGVSLKKYQNKKIYNLSKCGAYIENTVFCEAENIDLDYNFDKSFDKLKDFFLNKSRSELEKLDLERLEDEKKYVIKFKSSWNMLQNLKVVNSDIFIKTYIKRLEEFFDESTTIVSFISPVFRTYYNTVVPYLYYCINTRNIYKKELEELVNTFYLQVSRLLSLYLEYLEYAIKKA